MSRDNDPITLGTGPDAEIELRATVVEYEDRPDECTIYPVDASDDRRTVTWITAREGSFVDVRRCR